MLSDLYIEIMRGAEGQSLCLTDGDGSGIRIAGPKAWGGATTIANFKITESQAKDICISIKNKFPEIFKEVQDA